MEDTRLSAIMFTDIVGYTRKMGEDEERMMGLLQVHDDIVKPLTEAHKGEIVKKIGDAYMIKFDAAVDAVRCGLEIQAAHAKHNEGKDDADTIHIRAGIHLGDVMLKEGDYYGSGVNVAARVEPLAAPDGVCITKTVYDMVKHKLKLKALSLGVVELKNVDDQIIVFHLLTDQVGEAEVLKYSKAAKKSKVKHVSPEKKQGKAASSTPRAVLLGSIITFIAVALVIAVTSAFKPTFLQPMAEKIDGGEGFISRYLAGDASGIQASSGESVLVLPFENRTAKKSLSYMAAGLPIFITDNIRMISPLNIYPERFGRQIVEQVRSGKDVSISLSPQSLRTRYGAGHVIGGWLKGSGENLMGRLFIVKTTSGDTIVSKEFSLNEENLCESSAQMGVLILQTLSPEDAVHISDQLRAFVPSSSFALDLYLQGLEYIDAENSRDFQRSRRMFNAAGSADKKFWQPHLEVAELNMINMGQVAGENWGNDASAALYALKKAEEKSPGTPEILLQKARALTYLSDHKTADSLLSTLYKLHPTWIELHLAKADLSRSNPDPTDETVLMETMKSLLKSADFAARKGMVGWELEIRKAATDYISNDVLASLSLSNLKRYDQLAEQTGNWPEYENARVLWADYLLKQGKGKEALDLLDEGFQVLQSNGASSPDLVLHLANVQSINGDWEKALKLLESEGSGEGPVALKCRLAASKIYTETGQLSEAEAAVLEVLSKARQAAREVILRKEILPYKKIEAEGLEQLIEVQFALGHLMQSEKSINQLVSLVQANQADLKSSIDPSYLRARNYFYQGEIDSAIAITALAGHSLNNHAKTTPGHEVLLNLLNTRIHLFEDRISAAEKSVKSAGDIASGKLQENVMLAGAIVNFRAEKLDNLEGTLKDLAESLQLSLADRLTAKVYLGAYTAWRKDLGPGLEQMKNGVDSLKAVNMPIAIELAYEEGRLLNKLHLSSKANERFRQTFNLAEQHGLKGYMAKLEMILNDSSKTTL